MEATESQVDMTTEQTLADLGISTRLSEQFLMSMAPQPEMGEETSDGGEAQPSEGSEMPLEAPPQQVEEEVEESPQEEEKLDLEPLKEELKGVVKEAVKEEMKALKKELETALNED